MHNWLLSTLRDSFIGLIIFLIGFCIGTVIDVIFSKLYHVWDPKEQSKPKLVTLAIIQLFIVIFILTATASVKKLGASFTFGVVTSQIFLLVHTVETLSSLVHKRDWTA